MISWIIGACVVAGLLGSLSALSSSQQRGLKIAVTIVVTVAVTAYAIQLESSGPDPYHQFAGKYLLVYIGLFAVTVSYQLVVGFFANIEFRREETRRERAAREAAERARLAAEEQARQEAEARARAALARRLADLEKWVLQTYAYYSVQEDFDGSKPFDEVRAGFQRYIAGFDVPDLHILARSGNPKVQSLMQGYGVKALS